MARGKRSRPLLAGSGFTRGQNETEHGGVGLFTDGDEVEEFVANRHKQMANRHGLDDLDSGSIGNEPENVEYDVLNLDTFDSDENDSLDGEDSQDEEVEEKEDWGGNRRNWYGGDTHEYEIMEEEEREELLKEEEEEAIRLQKKALHRMRPEDYVNDEDDESGGDDQGDEQDQRLGGDASKRIADEAITQNLDASAPELQLLVNEFQHCFQQLSVWRERVHWNEMARMKYQLLGLFVTNIAFYFSLRSDPDSVGVDLRTHPVLSRIVQIRSQLRSAQSVPCEKPRNHMPAGELEKDKQGDNGLNAKAQEDLSVLRAKTGTTKRREVHGKQKAKRGEKKSRMIEREIAIAADEQRVKSLLRSFNANAVVDEEEAVRERKRRKLNKFVGAMERERKNSDGKRMASGDLDVVREEIQDANKSTGLGNQAEYNQGNVDAGDMGDDEEVMRKMLSKEKKEERKARKNMANAPHVYRFKDTVDPNKKRKASSQVIKNRGLTRYRPKDKKTPRTKNRLAYGKAVVRRKGAVREYAGVHGGSYGGEASGINMSARKSSKLS